MPGPPEERPALPIASLNLIDDAFEVRPGSIDPVPAEVAQRSARDACPGRGRERERRYVTEQDLDPVLDEQPGFDLRAGVELAGKIQPAATCIVDVQVQTVVLGNADIEWPTRRRQVLDLGGEQPVGRVRADDDPDTPLQKRP